MPYYHVRLKYKDSKQEIEFTDYELDLLEEEAKLLGEQYEKGRVFFKGKWFDVSNIREIEIRQTPFESMNSYPKLNPSIIFYGGRKDIRVVTRQFIKSPPKKEEVLKYFFKESKKLSKNIFIVHGRDHEPMKELKEMLYDFGLKPIILHEKESEGSLTLAEKLEEYSEDVGYVFVILTPDDFGCEKTEVERTISELSKKEFAIVRNWFELVFKGFKLRARQNVIFEMGYFWGLLKRKRVCCLLKGDVEKPSDIEGIVYIPFKDSVKEVQVKIMKKLTKAGYEIKM